MDKLPIFILNHWELFAGLVVIIGLLYEGTEVLVEMLVPALLPMLTNVIGAIEIPSFSGFSMSGVTAGVAGAEGGYVLLGGDLIVQ